MKKLIISLSMLLLTIGAYSQNSNPQSVTLGKNAGWNNTAPFNIFVGTNSGFNAPPTLSGRIYIGGYDSTSGLYANLNTGVLKINNIPIVKQSDSSYNIGSGLLLNGLTMYVNPNVSLQSPTANTQTRTDSTTKLATTAFVRSFMPLTTIGTGATCGKVTMLSSGSVTVNTTAVQTTSIILITNNSSSGNATTAAGVSAIVAGTSFTIQSGTADTSVYGWLIINP